MFLKGFFLYNNGDCPVLCVAVCPGVECQRPKQQVSSENELEAMSSGTADSPDLYQKTTPPTSSPPTSRPTSPKSSGHRRKSARFLRQTAVDDDQAVGGGGGGGTTEIQVLMEGPRGGARGPSPASAQDSHSNGHSKHSTNHRPREHGSSSNHRTGSRGSRSGHRLLQQGGGDGLGQLDEEKLSNYEIEMRPLQPRDAASQKHHAHHDERHHGDGRSSHAQQRQRTKLRERERAREGGKDRGGAGGDSELKQDVRGGGEKPDSRPLRRDLTLSPPQKSTPIALEHDDKTTQLKTNGVRQNTFSQYLFLMLCSILAF